MSLEGSRLRLLLAKAWAAYVEGQPHAVFQERMREPLELAGVDYVHPERALEAASEPSGWTWTPPAREGWYWARWHWCSGTIGEPQVLCVAIADGKLEVSATGNPKPLKMGDEMLDRFQWWPTPIPCPPEGA